MTTVTSKAPAGAPSLGLLSLEPVRAALEYASMRFNHRDGRGAGDGHPVVIFPGLGTDGRCVAPLRDFCANEGFAAHEWGRGCNTGPEGDVDAWMADLADHVQRLVSPSPQRMTLIGWSLGGIYARELAKLIPKRVRQVITIGTPFAGSIESTNVGLAYRILNGKPAELDHAMAHRLATAPPVPTTSVYSRTDGVVAWEACLQRGEASNVENVEVVGSHCGLGWNREVFSIVADRLHQPQNRWKPYRLAA